VKRRVLTVVLAVLLAGLGTAGVLGYVHQADARALAGQKAVRILVAEKMIPSGTAASAALQDGLLTSQTLPAAAVPSDALRSITPDLSSLVLSAGVQPGQLLLRPMLVTAVQVTGGLAIPVGMVAVTIQLCLPEAVAGNVHTGSQVAVFDTSAAKESVTVQSNCDSSQDFQSAAQTRILLSRVLVLSVGSVGASGQVSTQASTGALAKSTSATSSTATSLLVTLAVSPANAERLIQSTQTGSPYLALFADSSGTRVDTRLVPPVQP
jgi:pilus assembly protein CpaB